MKQVFYSEILNKTFGSEKECLEAEKKFEDAKKEAERKKANRAERAKEVEAPIQAARDADKKANDLLSKFVKDYGSYHTTISNPLQTLLDVMFDSFGI